MDAAIKSVESHNQQLERLIFREEGVLGGFKHLKSGKGNYSDSFLSTLLLLTFRLGSNSLNRHISAATTHSVGRQTL